MLMKREIDKQDIIMDLDAYAKVRGDVRKKIIAKKKNRRLPVGPNATFYFECYDTMLYQVQEMLNTERGGEEQLEDEISAYNPLIPQGNELTATFMLEWEDPVIRHKNLMKLGGIEENIFLNFDGHQVQATWEDEVERTTEDGKTSAIHFLHFKMTDEQVEAFKKPDCQVVVSIMHKNYGHMAIMPSDIKEELMADL